MAEEAKREAKLREAIKKKGGLCLKFTSPGYTGVPDRIIFLPGARIGFVELKAAKGVLSARQKLVHLLFASFGFPVIVISTDQQLNEFLENL